MKDKNDWSALLREQEKIFQEMRTLHRRLTRVQQLIKESTIKNYLKEKQNV